MKASSAMSQLLDVISAMNLTGETASTLDSAVTTINNVVALQTSLEQALTLHREGINPSLVKNLSDLRGYAQKNPNPDIKACASAIQALLEGCQATQLAETERQRMREAVFTKFTMGVAQGFDMTPGDCLLPACRELVATNHYPRMLELRAGHFKVPSSKGDSITQLEKDIDRGVTFEHQVLDWQKVDSYLQKHPVDQGTVPKNPLELLLTQHQQDAFYVPNQLVSDVMAPLFLPGGPLRQELPLAPSQFLNLGAGVVEYPMECIIVPGQAVKNYLIDGNSLFFDVGHNSFSLSFEGSGMLGQVKLIIPIALSMRFKVTTDGYYLHNIINNSEHDGPRAFVNACLAGNTRAAIESLTRVIQAEPVIQAHQRQSLLATIERIVFDEARWKPLTRKGQFPQGVIEMQDKIKALKPERDAVFPSDLPALNELLIGLLTIGQASYKPESEKGRSVGRFFQDVVKGRDPQTNRFYKIIKDIDFSHLAQTEAALTALFPAPHQGLRQGRR
jgi:hypothetical protein